MPASTEAVYLDSSAIVKLVGSEAESAALRRYVEGYRHLVSCSLARVEVVRAARRHSDGFIEAAREVLEALDMIRVDDALLRTAATLGPLSLRSLDAIHLAAAQAVGVEEVLTYDRRMASAASLVGLRTSAPGARLSSNPAVKHNRSIPDATVIPVLTYPDVRGAVTWLNAAFGFRERVRIGESHRAQMQFGGGAMIIADVYNERQAPRSGEVTHSITVRVADADAHADRARAYGARIIQDPTDQPFGERQYTAEDLAGHRWTFSQTIADVAPEEWGGIMVSGE